MESSHNAERQRTGNAEFYDALAEHYHLIFEDWDASMRPHESPHFQMTP